MNSVELSFEGLSGADWADEAQRFASAVLDRLDKDNWDLSLLFCDDEFITGLNRQYRGRDEATDVLSFEQGTTYRDADGHERMLAGDIVISMQALDRNVEEFGVARGEELRRLVIHGILHLSGMDHVGNESTESMLVLQEELLAELGPGEGAFA